MIKDNDYTNIVFATMCSFASRHLDNNQLEELPSGVFDHKRFLFELWVGFCFATEKWSYQGSDSLVETKHRIGKVKLK